MRGRERYKDKPRPYLRSVQESRIEELRRKANENLKNLAEERRKPKPDRPDKKKAPDRLDLYLGERVEELHELTKLEIKIARCAQRKKGFKGTDYSRGMWEEVDHRIEQLHEIIGPMDRKEQSRVKRIWRRHCRGKR